MDLLEELGVEVSYHDPHSPRVGQTRRHPGRKGLRSIELCCETIARQDAVVIVTDHSTVDYEILARHVSLADRGRKDSMNETVISTM